MFTTNNVHLKRVRSMDNDDKNHQREFHGFREIPEHQSLGTCMGEAWAKPFAESNSLECTQNDLTSTVMITAAQSELLAGL